MRDLSVKELSDLVVADVPDADARIEKMFGWHFERDMAITRWMLGAAAALAVSALVAFFKAEIKPNWWQTVLLTGIPLVTSSYGVYRLAQIRSIHGQFVSALKIYNELKQIRPFIVRYRRSIRP